jgi:anti-anti-sigma factor
VSWSFDKPDGWRSKRHRKAIDTEGGIIVIDLKDVTFLDSLGLGTLVGLKVSSINEGYCQLRLENLTPRLQELLKLTNLTKLFSS